MRRSINDEGICLVDAFSKPAPSLERPSLAPLSFDVVIVIIVVMVVVVAMLTTLTKSLSVFFVRRSLFFVLCSLFAVLRSPFFVRRSPFAVLCSPFAVLCSPFAVHRSPSAVMKATLKRNGVGRRSPYPTRTIAQSFTNLRLRPLKYYSHLNIVTTSVRSYHCCAL